MPNNTGLKNRCRFTVSVDKELVESLKEYSKKNMIPVSRLLDLAISRLLNQGISQDN